MSDAPHPRDSVSAENWVMESPSSVTCSRLLRNVFMSLVSHRGPLIDELNFGASSISIFLSEFLRRNHANENSAPKVAPKAKSRDIDNNVIACKVETAEETRNPTLVKCCELLLCNLTCSVLLCCQFTNKFDPNKTKFPSSASCLNTCSLITAHARTPIFLAGKRLGEVQNFVPEFAASVFAEVFAQIH